MLVSIRAMRGIVTELFQQQNEFTFISWSHRGLSSHENKEKHSG